ncbi:ABC transporter permease [Mycoplasmopsis synoviae]|uniref:ABC transporter n=1 Tax=Mycoplasmopsis synoviae TaxID=2109 RepID=A0A3B0PCD9_MYCSY|nr:ABC transporter permease [Mycoplasmopsis synoviae]AKB11374.1 multidrug ABC transporter permease [Mycoplasmopsis synoviae ATCC 25204]SYV93637.1 ABC transporter [Mycoplasmopsis synoviae]
METFNYLLKRNIKLFLRNRAKLFFLFLGPMITLFVFFFFVKRNFNVGTVNTAFLNIENLPRNVKAVVYPEKFTDNISNFLFNATLISGLISITAFTTATQLAQNIVHDKETRTLDDFFITPTKTTTIRLSYVVFNLIFNILITLFTLSVIYIYLFAAFKNSIIVQPKIFFSILGVTLISCVISSMFFVFIFSYVKTTAIFMMLNGMISSIGGFLIGGYFPISFLPKGLAGVLSLIPQTQAGLLLRNVALNHDFITESMNHLDYNNLKFMVENLADNTTSQMSVLEYFKSVIPNETAAIKQANDFVSQLTSGINSGIKNNAQLQIATQEISPTFSLVYTLMGAATFATILFIFKVSKRK